MGVCPVHDRVEEMLSCGCPADETVQRDIFLL